MMIYLHGLSYSVEFSVVFLTFILSFDFLFHFLEGNLHSFLFTGSCGSGSSFFLSSFLRNGREFILCTLSFNSSCYSLMVKQDTHNVLNKGSNPFKLIFTKILYFIIINIKFISYHKIKRNNDVISSKAF